MGIVRRVGRTAVQRSTAVRGRAGWIAGHEAREGGARRVCGEAVWRGGWPSAGARQSLDDRTWVRSRPVAVSASRRSSRGIRRGRRRDDDDRAMQVALTADRTAAEVDPGEPPQERV